MTPAGAPEPDAAGTLGDVNIAEIKQTDKLRAAIHEAGHLVIARLHGVHATASIWPTGDGLESDMLHDEPAT